MSMWIEGYGSLAVTHTIMSVMYMHYVYTCMYISIITVPHYYYSQLECVCVCVCVWCVSVHHITCILVFDTCVYTC